MWHINDQRTLYPDTRSSGSDSLWQSRQLWTNCPIGGAPKHARLVGYVLKHLDPESDLPWHRVINAQGKISTSRLNARGENIQQMKLLEEDVVVVAGKVSLKKYQWN